MEGLGAGAPGSTEALPECRCIHGSVPAEGMAHNPCCSAFELAK